MSWPAMAMLPGAVTLGIGGALDVAYHLGAGTAIGLVASLAGDDGESAHLVLFVGMALVVAGLLAIGIGHGRPEGRRHHSDWLTQAAPRESQKSWFS